MILPNVLHKDCMIKKSLKGGTLTFRQWSNTSHMTFLLKYFTIQPSFYLDHSFTEKLEV